MCINNFKNKVVKFIYISLTIFCVLSTIYLTYDLLFQIDTIRNKGIFTVIIIIILYIFLAITFSREYLHSIYKIEFFDNKFIYKNSLKCITESYENIISLEYLKKSEGRWRRYYLKILTKNDTIIINTFYITNSEISEIKKLLREKTGMKFKNKKVFFIK